MWDKCLLSIGHIRVAIRYYFPNPNVSLYPQFSYCMIWNNFILMNKKKKKNNWKRHRLLYEYDCARCACVCLCATISAFSFDFLIKPFICTNINHQHMCVFDNDGNLLYYMNIVFDSLKINSMVDLPCAVVAAANNSGSCIRIGIGYKASSNCIPQLICIWILFAGNACIFFSLYTDT